MLYLLVFVPLAATAALIFGALRGRGIGGPELGGWASSVSRRWWWLFIAVGIVIALVSGIFELEGREPGVPADKVTGVMLLAVLGGAVVVVLCGLLGTFVGFITETSRRGVRVAVLIVAWVLVSLPAGFALLLLAFLLMDATDCLPIADECPV